ncbi:TetR/AcrR family transcriptional regulator [Streptomyces brasiliscabiei]|uniref:TetR/AcrR family transcriptional regulator n=1 Tax=Streptomyces brasiliscabiei TaxID=2736302 RepID=UPI001C11F0F3|nr:TetR/AcrR family transcriptional regulator [Streptomyces brasiliscabiei]
MTTTEGANDANDAKTPRERYRAQVRAEVKQHAWEQIAEAGASALSLNAIAKRMGMSGPALYRYFAGRDELITELIRDAYRSLADTFREAAEAARAAEPAEVADTGADLATLAHALRAWALDDPHRYFLIYGTPIPGYHAPADTATITSEILATLLGACGDLPEDQALHRALTFWTRLHGALSLELAGHFTGMDVDPARFYAAEVDSLAPKNP